jgi:hypothetical protein
MFSVGMAQPIAQFIQGMQCFRCIRCIHGIHWRMLLIFLLFFVLPLHALTPAEQAALSCFPLAIITMVFVIGLAIMGAEFFQQPQMFAWAKVELTELVVAMILGIAMYGIINPTFLGLFLPTDAGGTPTYATFLNQLINYNRDMYVILGDAFIRVSKISGFSYDYSTSIGPISNWYSATPQVGLSGMLSAVTRAMDTLSASLLVVSSYKILIYIASIAGKAYVLPLAIALRVIPNTRKLGSALMALAIGMYIILPASVAFSGALLDQVMISSPQPQFAAYFAPGGPPDLSVSNANQLPYLPIFDPPPPPGYGTICNEWINAFTSLGEIGWAIIICTPLAPVVPFPVCKIWVTIFYIVVHAGFSVMYSDNLRNYLANVPINDIYETLYGTALPIVSQLFILSLALPLISLLLTFSLTKSVSMALGGEGQLYGLSKII